MNWAHLNLNSHWLPQDSKGVKDIYIFLLLNKLIDHRYIIHMQKNVQGSLGWQCFILVRQWSGQLNIHFESLMSQFKIKTSYYAWTELIWISSLIGCHKILKDIYSLLLLNKLIRSSIIHMHKRHSTENTKLISSTTKKITILRQVYVDIRNWHALLYDF